MPCRSCRAVTGSWPRRGRWGRSTGRAATSPRTPATPTTTLTSWITPPETWRDPPADDPPAELDLWELLAAARTGRATAHLLSKEGAGTAAPVVTALVDRIRARALYGPISDVAVALRSGAGSAT